MPRRLARSAAFHSLVGVVLAEEDELTGELASGSTSARVTARRNRSRRVVPPPSALPVLLRKEVIQPHLPVRLPCYDFVPIAEPTFDGSLHKGWATGFGCSRLS